MTKEEEFPLTRDIENIKEIVNKTYNNLPALLQLSEIQIKSKLDNLIDSISDNNFKEYVVSEFDDIKEAINSLNEDLRTLSCNIFSIFNLLLSSVEKKEGDENGKKRESNENSTIRKVL